jgi:hypothetical protein
MICLLYRDFLLLASALRTDQIYTVQACIGLSELRIEDIDNGRGKKATGFHPTQPTHSLKDIIEKG